MPRSTKSHASATGVAKSAAGQARAITASSKAKRTKRGAARKAAAGSRTRSMRRRAY
jgi:hypothetical protein